MEPVYDSVIGLCKAAFRVMDWDVQVTGSEHIPADGPGIVATNHVSYLDFIFVGRGVLERGRKLRFLAKQEIFDHWASGPLMRAMRHIPVDRGGDPAESLEAAVAALRRGEMIGMFPEATISTSFVPLPGKTGSARMAIETGAPLIPGAVWGPQRIFTKARPRDLRRDVAMRIAFAPPIETAPGDDPAELTDRLMKQIGALIDELQRTYPQSPEGDHDRWWLPAHLGGTAPTPEEARTRAEREAARRRRGRDAGGDATSSG